jgi:hypothetical protein
MEVKETSRPGRTVTLSITDDYTNIVKSRGQGMGQGDLQAVPANLVITRTCISKDPNHGSAINDIFQAGSRALQPHMQSQPILRHWIGCHHNGIYK